VSSSNQSLIAQRTLPDDLRNTVGTKQSIPVKIQGAVIKEQNQEFAVVVVKKHVIDSSSVANISVQMFGALFPGLPLVLAAQDSSVRFSYYGRKESVPISRPFRRLGSLGKSIRCRTDRALMPIQSLEPMARSVTPSACAEVAPALAMAHH